MPKPSPLPQSIADRPFAVDTALSHSVSRGRLRSSDLQKPFHGVRSSGLDLDAVLDRCAAYAARMRDVEFFSHATAAMLHGFPLPRRIEVDRRLHVGVAEPACPPQSRGVVGHQFEEGFREVMWLGAPVRMSPVTSPVYTWCSLATTLQLGDLVAVGDFLVKRVRPSATVDQLGEGVGQFAGRRGVATLRRALPLVRPGTDSRAESHLRLFVLRAGFPEPVVNHVIRNSFGGFVAMCDLAFVSERVVLEYEGDHHRMDRETFVSDIERRERIEDAGWTVIRVSSDDLYRHPDRLAARIRRRLARSRTR